MDKFYDYGIDLGTTNSCVARTSMSDVVIFQNIENMNVTPSAVHIDKRGRMFVGRKAYDKLISEPENTAVEFKRFMGIVHHSEFSSNGKKLTPIELSAEIIKSLREDVFRQTGSPLTDAVITVPASFDTRQCDATIKAGKLAGLDNIVLLQEPIAAAIAYGAKPNAKNQNWMIFDFGGGTLDIAIVSTHDNRLTVLNHEGDNRLGGKNIDDIICEKIIIPQLSKKYKLSENLVSIEHMKRRLRAIAEDAKKILSTANYAKIDIYDIGEDMNGELIELTLDITIQEFEQVISSIIKTAVSLAKTALHESKLSAPKLDKILLVGGTTQIPSIRNALTTEFQVALDTSIDSMTVVARGAAIYGSTCKIKDEPSTKNDDLTNVKLTAKLEYPPTTCEQIANLVGKLMKAKENSVDKIRINDASGIWTSGWLNLIDKNKGIFDVDIVLQENTLNFFTLNARDSFGNIIPIQNDRFTIRHNDNALITSAPPIPHSLCIEKLENGESCLEIMIKKGTQLPAKAVKKFISNKTLSPNSNEFIAIKIWEGENKNLTSNEWVGNVYIHGNALSKPIPEGFAIEVSITIDESRHVEVSAFVPHLDLVIQDKLMYNCEPLNLEEPIETITRELPNLLKQLENKNFLTENGTGKISELLILGKSLEKELLICKKTVGIDDERVMEFINKFNLFKGEIQDFEKQQAIENATGVELAELSRIDKAVLSYGTSSDREKLLELKQEYVTCCISQDESLRKEILNKMLNLKTMVMLNNSDFLKLALLQLSSPLCAYANATEAIEWKARGQLSLASSDTQGLQNAVIGLLSLSVDYNGDLFNQRGLPADLR